MTDDRFRLTRRKALAGIGAIGTAGVAAGLGTSALYSDEESFTDNSITAGTLDLYVDYETSVDQGAATGTTGSTTGAGTIQGNPASRQYVINDVKPGDSGSLEFCFALVDNPGYLWVSGALTGDSENGTTEPEGTSPWERQSDGELATYTRAELYYDTGDGETLITSGTLRGLLRDLSASPMPLHGNGDPTAGVLDRPTFGPSTDQEDLDETCLRLDWELPIWVGNEVQSDSLSFGLEFVARQARNNDGSGGWTVVQPGDSLSTAVGDASSGDTLLLASGTHSDVVTVDKSVTVRGEGPTNTTFAGSGSDSPLQGMAVEADGVHVGDLRAENWRQAISVNGQNTDSGRITGTILSNIVADGNGDRSLVVDYTDDALVRDIEITNSGNDGITLWYTNGSLVENVVANDNADNGIYVNGDNNYLIDVTAKRNVDEGVDINWYDDLGPTTQRVVVDNAVAMDNGEDDVELHDNGTDDAVADDSMLLRKVRTGGAPTGLRLVQVAESEVRVDASSFPNGQLDGSDNDVDP